MEEEIIALVPVLLLLCRRLGYDPLTAVAMSIGSSLVGAAFSPMNPFMSLIGQRVSEVALFSGWQYRTVFLVLAQTLWIAGTMRHAAAAHRLNPNHNPNPQPPESAPTSESKIELTPPPHRHVTALVLALVAIAFVAFIYGVLKLGWSFEEMTAVFFAMGLLAGLVGGLGVNGTARAFVEGFQAMAFAALLIGFARGIRQVLDDGGVIDTVVLGLFTPLAGWPRALAAAGMVLVQTLVHIPVPSVSGQAVLTLPILNPLADLLGLSRQVIVLAYQYGGGICGVWSPTNGSLLAILGASGVAYGRWLRFALPLCGLLLALGILAVVLAVMIGLQ